VAHDDASNGLYVLSDCNCLIEKSPFTMAEIVTDRATSKDTALDSLVGRVSMRINQTQMHFLTVWLILI
jgi:hypothetical protein